MIFCGFQTFSQGIFMSDRDGATVSETQRGWRFPDDATESNVG